MKTSDKLTLGGVVVAVGAAITLSMIEESRSEVEVEPEPQYEAIAGYTQRGDRPEYFGVCVGEDCRCTRPPCIPVLTVYPSGQTPWLDDLCSQHPNHPRCPGNESAPDLEQVEVMDGREAVDTQTTTLER